MLEFWTCFCSESALVLILLRFCALGSTIHVSPASFFASMSGIVAGFGLNSGFCGGSIWVDGIAPLSTRRRLLLCTLELGLGLWLAFFLCSAFCYVCVCL